jgi:lysophospholipase L1-like esterase
MHLKKDKKKIKLIITLATLVISTIGAVVVAEGILRFKNSSMKSYDIEMWRYARELKVRSDIELLGHEHIPSKSAILQSVNIRINEKGLRGPPISQYNKNKRRILFLGSSVTLGWGVKENETVTERIQEMFRNDGQDVDVLNAGIGNYNTVRYVERFKKRLLDLNPTDIVVHYFVRDAVSLEAGGGNTLLRNSQLAVTIWIAINRFLSSDSSVSLEKYYLQVYSPKAEEFIKMRHALNSLAIYCKKKNIRIYLVMTPDFHDLVDYKFNFIHRQIKDLSVEADYQFVDLLPAMKNLTPKQIWSMPGDPHPNGNGHKIMAEVIYPILKTIDLK